MLRAAAWKLRQDASVSESQGSVSRAVFKRRAASDNTQNLCISQGHFTTRSSCSDPLSHTLARRPLIAAGFQIPPVKILEALTATGAPLPVTYSPNSQATSEYGGTAKSTALAPEQSNATALTAQFVSAPSTDMI